MKNKKVIARKKGMIKGKEGSFKVVLLDRYFQNEINEGD